MKYVVLARDSHDGIIINSFGVFNKKKNAEIRLHEVKDLDAEYCIEEVDPQGSFADDEPED